MFSYLESLNLHQHCWKNRTSPHNPNEALLSEFFTGQLQFVFISYC